MSAGTFRRRCGFETQRPLKVRIPVIVTGISGIVTADSVLS
jgi:hypothetical protein